jgi:hypothetical protein
LLRQIDAIFAPKAVVPPNFPYLQSGRFDFVVSADLDEKGRYTNVFLAAPVTRRLPWT